MDYAVKVEAYTLGKAANLVLNVDGCIGALFLDLLNSSSQFSHVSLAAETFEGIMSTHLCLHFHLWSQTQAAGLSLPTMNSLLTILLGSWYHTSCMQPLIYFIIVLDKTFTIQFWKTHALSLLKAAHIKPWTSTQIWTLIYILTLPPSPPFPCISHIQSHCLLIN